MLADAHYDDLKVSDIAHNAGVAKGTVFLYFSSKEELFLEAARLELYQWFSDLSDGLKPLLERDQTHDVESFLRILAQVTGNHVILSRLMRDTVSRFFHGAGEKARYRYFSSFTALVDSGGQLIEEFFPYLERRKGQGIFSRILAALELISGYGVLWGEYVRQTGMETEDALISESPARKEEGILPASDFFIHSIRRILKGYSIQ